MSPEKTEPDCTDDDQNVNVSTISTASDDTNVVNLNDTHEPYFEPVVTLPEVDIKTNEEEEAELLKLRCKLFRFVSKEVDSPEWKERGTGDVKILQHNKSKAVRLLMRQDKTLKIRANHYITPFMELKENCKSDRAWVWSVRADFADEEPKYETFAIRFANAEHANQFKKVFDEAKGIATLNRLQEIADEIVVVQEQEEAEENVQAEKVGSEIKEEDSNSETQSSTETPAEDKISEELEKLSVNPITSKVD